MKHYLKPRKRAFALVISLSLMALVVLLVLVLSSLLRVEKAGASQARQMIQARQNAILGGSVALGNLQRHLGPDQRATANAELLNPATPNPLWTGVFRTVNFNASNAQLETLRTWATEGERIFWLFSHRGTGAINLAADVSDNPEYMRLARFDQSSGDTLDAYAQRILFHEGANRNATFSWWVSDESQKARISIPRDEPVHLTQLERQRADFSSAQLTDLRTLSPAWLGIDALRPDNLPGSLNSPRQLTLLNVTDTVRTSLADLSPRFTFFSETVPVDVTQGRLKQDLTAYLGGLSATINDNTPIIRGHSGDNYTGPPLALRPDAADIPRFGTIRNWAGLSAGTPLPQASNPADGRQHFAPMVMRVGLWYRPGLDYGPELTPAVGVNPATYAPAGLTWRFLPAIVVWNPYDHTIAASDYLIQLTGDMKFMLRDLWTQRDAGANQMRLSENQVRSNGGAPGQVYIARNAVNPSVPVLSWSLYNALVEDGEDDHFVDAGSRIRWLNFVARDLELQPGEARVLMPQHERDYRNEPASFYFNPANRSGGNTLLPDVYQDNGYIMQTGLNVYRSGDLSQGPPAAPLYAFFWPKRSTGGNPNANVEFRFRLWALDAPGGPQIVQDAVTFNSAAFRAGRVSGHMDVLASRIPNPDLPETHAQFAWQRGYRITPSGPLRAYDIRGTYEFADYNSGTHFRSFSTHFIGLGGSPDPRWLSSLNLFGPSMGSSLRDVGVSQNMGANMVYTGGIPGWRVDTNAWPSIQNRYGNEGSPTIMHVHQATLFTAPASHDHIVNHLWPTEATLTSLGQLQNVSLSSHLWQPQRPVGNSLPPPFQGRAAVFEALEGQTAGGRAATSRSRAAIDANNARLDITHALNSSLWDRFYLSTLPYNDPGFSMTEDAALAFARNQIVPSLDGSIPTLAVLESGTRGFQESAANIRVRGGFNVNSTSVEAWKLLLASSFNREVPTVDGDQSNTSGRFTFPRTVAPYSRENTAGGGRFLPEDFNAIKSLSEAEVQRLAEEIVEEIRVRGPFLSLADFVNRRLVTGDPRGRIGAVQEAIDRVSREVPPVGEERINREFLLSKLPANTTKPVAAGSFGNNTTGIFSGPEAAELVENYFAGLPTNASSSSYRGGSRYLMQADVLGVIGPLLTVRGDTFTIRAYGEESSSTGQSVTRTLLEVTVQRVASPLSQADSVISPNPTSNTEPLRGRAFRVVAARWLDPTQEGI